MKYKVLKDFLYDKSLKYEEGDILVIDENDYRKGSTDFLLLNGYIEEIKNEPWRPQKEELYSYITDGGLFKCARWVGCTEDRNRLEIGNYFNDTMKAAEAFAWLKAFKTLRDDTKGFKPDWGDITTPKYGVFYNQLARKLEIQVEYGSCFVSIYFTTESDAEESIKNHRQEWLIFLGVESE